MLTFMWSPARWTKTAISYATSPTSAWAPVRTARHVPCPAAVTNRKPEVISMIVCRTSPPPKWRPAPRASDWNPAAMAARCSASPRSSSREAPSASPSWDRNTARWMWSTLSTRSSRSQSSWLTGYRWLISITTALCVLLRFCPALLPAALHGGQGVSHVRQRSRGGLRNPRGPGRVFRGGRAELRSEASLSHPAGQALVVSRADAVGVPLLISRTAAVVRAAVGWLAGRRLVVRGLVLRRLAEATAVGGGGTLVTLALIGPLVRGEDVEVLVRHRTWHVDRNAGDHRHLAAVPAAPGTRVAFGRPWPGAARLP